MCINYSTQGSSKQRQRQAFTPAKPPLHDDCANPPRSRAVDAQADTGYGSRMETVDLIIDANCIVTVDTDNRVLPDHSLVISKGKIRDIVPAKEHPQLYQAAEYRDRSEHILMPGLINAHTHLPMNLMRGFADDLPLMTWLQEHIWPAEARWLTPEYVAAGTRLALAESIRGGVTCCNDMYFFPDTIAEQCLAAGVRGHVGIIVLDFPSAWANEADEYISKGLALHDSLRDQSLVHTTFAPHAPYTVSQGPLEKIAMLSTELDIPVHMHVHETATEVNDFVQAHGCRPLSRLAEIGLVNPALLAVHATQLTADEIAQLAEAGAHVLHCPESNMKLASGACPVSELSSAGVNIAIGTDGAASNNDIDMFGEMRSAALLAKHCSADASSVPATLALRMATINAATALGIGDQTGSLEVGKAADLIAISCEEVSMTPIFDHHSHLVYATDRHCVSDVWVAGQTLLQDGELTTLDLQQIRHESRDWAQRLQSSRPVLA